MFYSLTNKNYPDPANVRFQCFCETEYSLLETPGCPACGKKAPKAVSVDNGPWKPYQQFRIEGLRRILEPGALDEVPAEHRDGIRKNIERQIRQLEDGSWKKEAKDRIQWLRMMLAQKTPEGISSAEHEAMRSTFASQVQSLKEQLEAVGEPAGEEALPAITREYFTGKFTRPKVTQREWEGDPMSVAFKVALAVIMHIQPEKMTQPQQSFACAWHYFKSTQEGAGGHGEILFNRSQDSDKRDIEMSRKLLLTVYTPEHAAVFQKAEERWNSKPRQYPTAPAGDREKIKAWIKEIFHPVSDEFRDIDEEARLVKPTLESCIVAYLQKYRDEFVEIVERL